jgi:hypothetical protein
MTSADKTDTQEIPVIDCKCRHCSSNGRFTQTPACKYWREDEPERTESH